MAKSQDFARADLSGGEVHRRAGGLVPGYNDAVRRRLVALLEPSPAADHPASNARPDDARQAGALVVRLGTAATATAIAGWTGWTLERTHAALEDLDQRLEQCGLSVVADPAGSLALRDRALLRSRPVRPPLELAERLDTEEFRHFLAHLVRGETCPANERWEQPLLDLGVAVPSSYPGLRPTDVVAAAFVGVARRERSRPAVVEISTRDVSPGDRSRS